MVLSNNITGFEHLGIPVKDIKISRQFYQNLGFQILSNQEIEDEKGLIKVSFLDLNGFCLELYQVSGPSDRHFENCVIDHVAFKVKNIEEAYKELLEKEFLIQERAPVFLPLHKNGVKYFNVLGPDKERVEFIQIL